MENEETVVFDELVPESWVSTSVATRMILTGVAIFFFILGIIFWLLPVLTGLPFHAVALVAIAMTSRRVCRWINRWDKRMPQKIRTGLRYARDKMSTRYLAWKTKGKTDGGADSGSAV